MENDSRVDDMKKIMKELGLPDDLTDALGFVDATDKMIEWMKTNNPEGLEVLAMLNDYIVEHGSLKGFSFHAGFDESGLPIQPLGIKTWVAPDAEPRCDYYAIEAYSQPGFKDVVVRLTDWAGETSWIRITKKAAHELIKQIQLAIAEKSE